MYSDRVDSVTRATNPSPLSSPLSPLPLPFACRPLLRHLSFRRNHHCHHWRHHLLPSLLSLPSSSFAFFFTIFASFRFFASTRSDASACKARSRGQTGVFLSLLLPLYTLSRPLDLSSVHVTFHSLPFFPYSSHNYLSQFFDPSYSPLPWYPLYLSVFAILSSVTLSRSLFRSIRARVRLTASLHLPPPCRRLRRYTEICIGAESRAQKERDYRGPLTYYREPPLACL